MVTDYSDVKLETKDLILKKAEFEDWKTIYYNLWRHKESAKYMLWQPTETDEDAKDRMKRTIAFEEKPENKYALFVYLKKTGEAIGFAGMRELEPGIYEETGIALGPEFVQKGYGRQILTTLLEEAGKLGAKEFHACNRITRSLCCSSTPWRRALNSTRSIRMRITPASTGTVRRSMP